MARVLRLDTLQPFQAVNVLSDPGELPGPVIIPNCAMVRLNWNLADGKVGRNILHATYSGTPALSATVAQAIFTNISTGANWAALAAFLSTTTSLASVTVLDRRSMTATEFTSTTSAVPGTSAGTALPDESAVVVTIRTANRGPSGRGRFYIPGWASNAVGTGGTVAAAAVSALSTWAAATVFVTITNQLGAPVLGLKARQAYTSPTTGRTFPARAATTIPATQFLVRNNTWDSQRRRGLR